MKKNPTSKMHRKFLCKKFECSCIYLDNNTGGRCLNIFTLQGHSFSICWMTKILKFGDRENIKIKIELEPQTHQKLPET